MKKGLKLSAIFIVSFILFSFTTLKTSKIHQQFIGKWSNINKQGEFKTFDKNRTFYNSTEKDGVEKKLSEGKFKAINDRMYTENIKETVYNKKENVKYRKEKMTTNLYEFSKNADTLIINNKEYFKRVN